MKWFRKLFQGKCASQTEAKASTSKIRPWSDKFDSSNSFVTLDVDFMEAEEALEALDVFVPVSSEVYALTTIKNFRSDTLKDFVYESDWVFVSREQLMEPKFQRRLKKADTLTELCRSLAERSVSKRRAEVVARPPNCHCHELRSSESEKPLRSSSLCRIIKKIKNMCRHLCLKLKHFKIFKSEDVESPKPSEDPIMSFTSTNIYLCR